MSPPFILNNNLNKTQLMIIKNGFRLAFGLVLLFLFFSNTLLTAQDVTISGNCAAVNSSGTPYVLSGMANGRNQYVRGVCTIRFNGTDWEIDVNVSISTIVANAPDNSELFPPQTGWTGTGAFGCGPTSNIVLPVELSYFNAEQQENAIILSWSTVAELNNEGFFVQRSEDAKRWENLGFVSGNGTSQATQFYNFKDEAPLAGLYYYRLKQMDYDGVFEFSRIQVIEVGNPKEETLVLYPNPVNQNLFIPAIRGAAIIYNQMGQKVKTYKLNGTMDFIPVADLSSGTYLLELISEKGTRQTGRFVK